MKKINSITIETEIDEWPDISYLGEVRQRKETGNEIPTRPDDIKNTEWFKPCNHLPHDIYNWRHASDEEQEKVIKQYGSLRKADIAYAYQDLKRLENFYASQWWMEVITIRASIAVSDDGEHWAFDEIVVSLGGIESDGSKEYKEQIKNDLISEMKHELELWKFRQEEIETKIKEITNEQRI
jgi:predicted Fe-S protein YdhL (DUF1289 family)